jgi:glycerol-3-phosphate dehydrogenase
MIRDLTALTNTTFDLLIVGGGITGAGVALDAALRGLQVALIDKGDFASGTSSVSSKLVHGGLRYLEHGDFRLVYEALHERGRLLHNAPHLVRPLRFLLPFYEHTRVPPWQWRVGLMLYDLLAGTGNIRRSRPVDRGRLQREFPNLRANALIGGAEFYDAQMDDARLCLEVIRTAALQGAVVANYVEAVAFERGGAWLSGVRVHDHIAGSEFLIRARQVVNATGPWSDRLRRLAGDASRPLLRPTKGVHLIVPNQGLTAAFLLLHPADGRVFFVIPWLGKTLLGTTDTACEDSPDALSVLPDDIAYLLAGYNQYFEPPLTSAKILSSFVGLRPLIGNHAANPSALSREFQLTWSPSGLLSVAGGKYTTFRHMAEVITDAVVQRLGLRRRCRTHNFPLDGTPQEAWLTFEPRTIRELQQRGGLSEETARHLVSRYGRRYRDVAAYMERDPALRHPVVAGEPDLRAEFAYQRDHEMAVRPDDFLLRRTRLGLFHPEVLQQPLP